MQDDPAFFRQALLHWAAAHPRPLPWKGQSDPYKIWLSEIILQQTRVEQGLPYYERFVAAYPTVRQLADAPEEELMKLWEGLGYYARARNLHAAARYVADELGEKFPTDYAGLRQLRGVGDYTAAAIASFAYGLPHAVVDGNVYRVLARYFGIATPTDTPAAKRQFADLAQHLLDPVRPGAFNQALMDFGATCCQPRLPRCPDCPLRTRCVALATGQVADLPVKSKKAPKKERLFLYLVLRQADHTWVRKRRAADIWQDLFEFPMVEVDRLPTDVAGAVRQLATAFLLPLQLLQGGRLSGIYQQTLTHREVKAMFFEIHLPAHEPPFLLPETMGECQQAIWSDLKKKFAFPKLTDRYLRDKAVVLTLF